MLLALWITVAVAGLVACLILAANSPDYEDWR